MTIAYPGSLDMPVELVLEFEESICLVPRLVWLDVRNDSGRWYASLRIAPKEPPVGAVYESGVNGYCDCWRGPYASRNAAMSNGYCFGRSSAIAAQTPIASTLPRRVWNFLEQRRAA